MGDEQKSKLRLEIDHVLFIDIVGYSKLRINEQSAQIDTLRDIVRGTEQFHAAEAEGKLLRLPSGDGGALAFRNSPEAPVLCAEEIARALKSHPDIQVRMGIHSGPVNEVTDLNEQANIAGAGINIAQRIMDCGDAGHILVSKHAAEDLEQYDQWQPYLHDLGECEGKHGERLHVVNLYNNEIGNPAVPGKFGRKAIAGTTASAATGNRRRYSIVAMAIGALIVLGGTSLFLTTRTAFRNIAGRGAPALPASEKSIAVLPFQNLSDDKSNGYFTDGIQDEILTRLSKIAALKVISRTSTQKYKSAPENLREVGRQLGVANFLEGSVQKVANAVHVNVQLIRAATDERLWAESYNRKLDDVFGVEGEVANAIADQLNAKLSGAEQKAVAEKPTQNAAAYDAYLRAIAIDNEGNLDTTKRVADLYVEAVRLDPQFALAWAHLAVARRYLYFKGFDLDKHSVARGNEGALAVKALSFQAQGRLNEAAEILAKGPANSQNEALTFARVSQLYGERRFDEAIAQIQQHTPAAFANDPRIITFLGLCQQLAGKTDEARATFTRAAAAMKPTPDSIVAVDARQLPCHLAWAYAGLGEKEKALEQARQAITDYDNDALSIPFAETALAIV